MRIRTAALATALIAGLSVSAGAFAPTPKGEQALETADAMQAPRSYRDIVRTAPATARVAIDRIRAAGLGHLLWDADTDVASQLWGAGVPAPGANASPAAAEAAARAFLADHLAVLAPGGSVADFVMVSNVERDGIRAVGFFQHWNGTRVLGGQVGFQFKRDRLIVVGSTALPHVTATATNRTFKPDALRAGAQGWIAAVTGRTAVAGDAAGTEVVLPIVHRRTLAGPAVDYRMVHTVPVKLTDAVGAWDVYVDTSSGAPLARTSKIRFAEGTIVYNVPERWPGGTRTPRPAMNATHTVNGAAVTSDASGKVTWTTAAPATVTPGLFGPLVQMHSTGGLATTSLTLAASGQATWDESADGRKDAMLTSFISANVVKAYIKQNIAPNLAFLDQQLDVYVNESGSCNAYSTGDDIHFFPANAQCENTGRLPDVVYHEFGHSVHDHAIIPGVGQFAGDVSEGIADTLAATITNDHGMGRGFFFSDQPLRDLDPVGTELHYPENITGEVHADGEIIGETLWDLRKALIAQMTNDPGIRQTEKIWYHILEVSIDLPSTFAAALAADDDDGNLDNGTPHHCAIRQAFGTHGLATIEIGDGGIGRPTRDNLTVSVRVTAPSTASECPPPTVTSGELLWSVRGVAGTGGRLDMTQTDLGGGNSTWDGTLPGQADATVVLYRIELTLTDGSQLVYPDNPADPYYEMYIGQVEPIWCDDFESGAAAWTHGFDAGADEWQTGAPAGLAGDPTTAVSGTAVMGTDLIDNGEYRRNASMWAKTPAIDVTGHDGIRLQYKRWLNVEDGFFDTASISVDGGARWSNLNSMQGDGSTVAHRDREWRFHDLDLAAEAADGSVQIEFRLDSDPGLQFGGWTMDDVCVVARLPGGICGDGTTAGVEQCDDGNTIDGDGCSASCLDEEAPPIDTGCCSTGTGSGGPIVLGLLTLGLIVRRRRRA